MHTPKDEATTWGCALQDNGEEQTFAHIGCQPEEERVAMDEKQLAVVFVSAFSLYAQKNKKSGKSIVTVDVTKMDS